jgi:hypothetical protein
MDLNWSAIQRRDGSYDWTRYDTIFERAAAAGVRIMPVLVGSPRWVAARPQWPPQSRSDRLAFRRFTAAAVDRYGPHGSFWAGKPYPSWLRAWWWQVWNEPNHRSWWTDGRPDARAYASLLIEISGAAKGADSDAKILSAGLPQARLARRCAQLCIYKFLTDAFEVRGAARAVDAVAVHTYSVSTRDVLTRVDYAREAMRNFSDAREKHTWVTEMGWATDGQHPRYPTVSVWEQARRLKATYRLLLDARRSRRLLGAVWFSFRDPELRTDWYRHTGLFDWRGRAKPGWRALIEVTGGSG